MSLIVTDLNGNAEMLTDYNIERTRKLNKDYSLSIRLFETERNIHSYHLVQKGSEVEYDNQIYKVVQLNKRSVGIKSVKNIEAIHVYFDLVYKNQYDTIGGNKTIDEFFTFALNGTGFTFEVVDTFEAKSIFNFGADSVFNLIEILKDEFNCEIELEGRHLKIVNQIGDIDSNFQFRYKYNIRTIEENEDITNLETYIRGYGANGIMVEYTSPLAQTFGILEAPIYTNEEITTEAELLELIKKEIKDEIKASYKIEVAEIEGDAKFGNTGFIIHEPFGLEFEARIVEYKDFPETNKSPIVVVGNILETRSNKQTMLNKQVQNINKKTEKNSSEIRQTNEQISLEVERLDTEKASTASVGVLADEIELKVSETDYNGNEIASRINQTATTITIDASKIDLNGKVTFSMFDSTTQNTINGKADSSSLGALAGLDVVEKARLGTTVIEGGYISADLLLADRITAGSLATTAQINVGTSAYIGNNIYLGDQTSTGVKRVYFNDTARIEGGDGFFKGDMSIRAENVKFPDASSIDFNNATISGLNVTARFG